MGRDPLLDWFVEHEPILTPWERLELLIRFTHDFDPEPTERGWTLTPAEPGPGPDLWTGVVLGV